MRHTARIVRIMLVLLCSAVLWTTTASAPAGDPPLLPLWEPDWSPHTLLPNQLTLHADSAVDACIADIDADGFTEVVSLGFDSLHTLDLVDGVVHERKAILGDPYCWAGEPVRGKCLAAGDVDQDTLPDFVIGTALGELLVFRQLPHPMRLEGEQLPMAEMECALSQRIQVNEGVHRLWLIDHVGNIYIDLFVPNSFNLESPLRIFLGDGVGHFEDLGVMQEVTGTVHTIQSGLYEGELGVWIGSTHGVWFAIRGSLQATRVLEYGGTGEIIAEDFDSDGHTDIAVPGSSLHVFMKQAQGFEEKRYPIDIPVAYWMEKGDLNGDGEWDLILGDKHIAQFTAYLWEDGAFVHAGAYGIGYDDAARSMRRGLCADLTGDGKDEVIIPLSIAQIAALTTEGGYRSPQLSAGNTLLGQGDIDGDGTREVLVSDGRPGVSKIEHSSSGLMRTQSLQLLDSAGKEFRAWSPFTVNVANINGDDLPDLIGLSGSNLNVWMGTDSAWVFRSSIAVGALASPQLMTLDLDDDGLDECLLVRARELVMIDVSSESDVAPILAEIDWGGSVGALAQLLINERITVVGLRVDEEIRLQAFDSRGIRDLELPLNLNVMSCAAVDADQDGNDELAFVGVGVFGEGEDAHYDVQVGLAEIGDKRASLLGLWDVPNWMAWSIPFPYTGLVALPAHDRAPTFYVSQANGVTGRTYVDVIRPEWSETKALSQRLIAKSGVALAALEREDQTSDWLLSIPEINPWFLQLVEVKR